MTSCSEETSKLLHTDSGTETVSSRGRKTLVPCDLWEIFDTWQSRGHSAVSAKHEEGQGVTQESRGEQLCALLQTRTAAQGRGDGTKRGNCSPPDPYRAFCPPTHSVTVSSLPLPCTGGSERPRDLPRIAQQTSGRIHQSFLSRATLLPVRIKAPGRFAEGE